MGTRTALVVLVVGLLAASSCASDTEDRSGPGADGAPSVLGACAEEEPECQDTLIDDDRGIQDDDPVAPTDEGGSVSSGMVIEPLTVREALEFPGGGPIAVAGYVVRTSDSSLLCEALAESFPPQCGGDRVTITNPEATDALALLEESGVQWSPEPVTVIGEITSRGFTIDPLST